MARKSSKRPYEKESRCWPGYEPVPGRGRHEEGSCRKKPASRNAGVEVKRETARKKAEKHSGSTGRARIKTKSSSPRIRAEGRKELRRAAKR